MSSPGAPVSQGVELPSPSADERSLASLAHALQIVGSFIAPLIIFLIRRDSKFVAFHALQALLLQVVYMILAGAMMAVMIGGIFLPLIMSESQRERSDERPATVEQKADDRPSSDKAGDASKAEPPEPQAPPKKTARRKNQPPPVWFFIVFPVFWMFHMGAWVLLLVVAIVYCIKASRGEWAAYPIVGRWARRLLR
jgi:uncharacterized membrane protein